MSQLIHYSQEKIDAKIILVSGTPLITLQLKGFKCRCEVESILNTIRYINNALFWTSDDFICLSSVCRRWSMSCMKNIRYKAAASFMVLFVFLTWSWHFKYLKHFVVSKYWRIVLYNATQCSSTSEYGLQNDQNKSYYLHGVAYLCRAVVSAYIGFYSMEPGLPNKLAAQCTLTYFILTRHTTVKINVI